MSHILDVQVLIQEINRVTFELIGVKRLIPTALGHVIGAILVHARDLRYSRETSPHLSLHVPKASRNGAVIMVWHRLWSMVTIFNAIIAGGFKHDICY